MTGIVEIIATSPLNTVQDLGRFGVRRHGVGNAGAMDGLALRAGNALLGNEDGAAGIEVQTFPFRLRFLRDSGFAVTGADARPLLDDQALPPWWATSARAGQVLTLRPPREGARAYVTLTGGVTVPVLLGSRSTQLRGHFGGLDGRPLRDGDRLPGGQGDGQGGRQAACGALRPALALEDGAGAAEQSLTTLRVLVAAEYERFTPAMQARFWETEWRITPQSDRTGYRLAGPALLLEDKLEMRSYGVVPGIVQVPPAGQPMVQMADANTAGGYPRMATIIDADLWRLAQAPIGTRVRFRRVEYAAAVAAAPALDAYIARLRHTAELYRGLAASRRQASTFSTTSIRSGEAP